MERTRQKQIVEALILGSSEPITAAKIAEITPHVKPAQARALVAELANEYKEQDRGVEIWEVAGGYQIRTRPDLANYVRQLQKERPLRLSRAALETLSVIAYKQPITRGEIENVRGVEAGPVVRSLVDRDLVRIAGHREVPGRPIIYGTTKRFLEVFGLNKLDDLPTLREIEELLPTVESDAPGGGTDAAAATTDVGGCGSRRARRRCPRRIGRRGRSGFVVGAADRPALSPARARADPTDPGRGRPRFASQGRGLDPRGARDRERPRRDARRAGRRRARRCPLRWPPREPKAHQYWLLHKPRGVLTTRSDPHAAESGRETVMALVPERARRAGVFPVGRLDAGSEACCS